MIKSVYACFFFNDASKTPLRLSECNQSINQSINQSQDLYPNIAIILPVYNVARYLPECLDSVLSQTYENFTVFAIDDGATDNSGKILDEYASKDNRIKVTHKSNGGVSSARNVALEQIEATGGFDYVCFIDPDDYISQFYLEKFVSLILQYRPDIAFCGFQEFDKTGLRSRDKLLPKTANPYNRDALISRIIATGDWQGTYASTSALWNLMISADIILGERFEQSISFAEDTLFNLKITAKANKGAYVDEILYFYRQRKSSLTKTKDRTPTALAFCEHFFDFPEQVRPFLANYILPIMRSSLKMLTTKETDILRDRMQRIFEFIKNNIDISKCDKEMQRKYKKMISWPLPLYLFYIRYLRKDIVDNRDDRFLFE